MLSGFNDLKGEAEGILVHSDGVLGTGQRSIIFVALSHLDSKVVQGDSGDDLKQCKHGTSFYQI